MQTPGNSARSGIPALKKRLEKILSEKNAEGFVAADQMTLSALITEMQSAMRPAHLSAGKLLCVELASLFTHEELIDKKLRCHTRDNALHALLDYLSDDGSVLVDKPVKLIWPVNDIRAVCNKPLLTENLFVLPDEYSAIKSDVLASVLPATDGSFDGEKFYRKFSAALEAIYRGDNRQRDLEQLAVLCRSLIDESSHEYAAIFWFGCSTFAGCIKAVDDDVMPAVRRILQEIDVVIKTFIVDADTPLLSVEGAEAVERVLCNMLCFIALQNPDDPIALKLEQQFEMSRSLHQIDALADAGNQVNGAMLVAAVQAAYRWITKTKLAIDAIAEPGQVVPDILPDHFSRLQDVCSVVCRDAAGHIETAYQSYKRFIGEGRSVADRDDSATSLMLAERSMITDFPHQLASEGFASSGLSYDDESVLDELLVKELRRELLPLISADTYESEESEEFSAPWLKTVLLNTLSGAVFLSDGFLAEELTPLQSHSDALLLERHQALMLQLAHSIVDYLTAYMQEEKRTQTEEEVHLNVVELRNSMMDDLNAIPGLAELVHNNSDLLNSDDAGHSPEQIWQDADEDTAQDINTVEVQKPVELTSNKEIDAQANASPAFGADCNVQVDIIQHALDTALGSSGNLAPDNTVLTALDNLQSSVDAAGLEPLLRLIEPLSQMLISAEKAGSTLSQSDTLLVQEAIVAITLGVDSLVNGKPMSSLVADVTERMTAVAIDGRHQLRGEYESAGLIDIFVEEAEEHLQRLFELFQRWRGAPQGGSRIHSDISRLLHTVKGSADTVGLSTVAGLIHHLESAIVDGNRNNTDAPPSTEFFDIALDTIETLSDDVDRIRNSEQLGDRSELIARLQSLSVVENNPSVGSIPFNAAPGQLVRTNSPRWPATNRFEPAVSAGAATGAPSFGSARYFSALEVSERLLSRNNGDVLEVHDELKSQVEEMRSSLQSAKYLVSNSQQSQAGGFHKSLVESLTDLENIHRNIAKLMGRVASIDERQRLAMQGLTALVATADKVSVDSFRVRMDSVLQKSAESLGKRVNFRFLGADLDIERKLFSDLAGPLEQLVTNAVVHGIEGRVARKERTKPEQGTVELSFEVNDNTLVVKVSDDGAGIDIAELRRRITTLPNTDASVLQTDTDVLGFVVEQGVSTAHRADRASGRGVGLDVVLQKVFSHRGKFSVKTTALAGTQFTISIPLSEVACQVMVVSVGGRYFAIDRKFLNDVQDTGHDAIRLGYLLGINDAGVTEESTTINCTCNGEVLSLKVDRIVAQTALNFNLHDAVLKTIPWCTGSALLDGREVVLLLDARYLAKRKVQLGPEKSPQSKPAGATTDEMPEVLIVDDSVTIRASFGRAMKTAGFGIQLARNGIEAIDILKTRVPAVVILDLEMPEMNGFDLAAYIRSEKRMDHTKLLVVSSRPKSEIEEWLESIKAVGYFEKPCTEQVLAEAVAGLIAG